MTTATFVTTNDIKFNAAEHILVAAGISLAREQLEFEEIQAGDGEPIARHKAQQAFASLQRPLIVTDDTWLIPGLGGFPGPYMKDVNDWLNAEDFLRLVKPLEDRRIILRQHAVYQDLNGQHYFVEDVVGTLLSKATGSSKSSILELTSFDNTLLSHAERIASGSPGVPTSTVWSQIAAWLKQKQT